MSLNVLHNLMDQKQNYFLSS